MPTMTDIRLPDLELPKVDLPKALADAGRQVPDLSSIDIGKAVSDVADAMPFRETPRRRWPLAAGAVVVASVVGWAILGNQAVRARLTQFVTAARERVRGWTGGGEAGAGNEPEDAFAFPAAATRPIERDTLNDRTPGEDGDAPDYPARLGSAGANDVVSPEGLEPSTR